MENAEFGKLNTPDATALSATPETQLPPELKKVIDDAAAQFDVDNM